MVNASADEGFKSLIYGQREDNSNVAIKSTLNIISYLQIAVIKKEVATFTKHRN